MNDTPKKDIAIDKLSSKVFPIEVDMAVWESLSDAEKYAVIERDEEAGFRSGVAEMESLEDRLARVRASMAHVL